MGVSRPCTNLIRKRKTFVHSSPPPPAERSAIRGGGEVRYKIHFLLIFGVCCSPDYLEWTHSQNGLISTRDGCLDMTRRSCDLHAHFQENVWKIGQKEEHFHINERKSENLLGRLFSKLTWYVHLMVLQKPYAGIVKIWIFRPVALYLIPFTVDWRKYDFRNLL